MAGGEPGRGMKASAGGVTEDKERVPKEPVGSGTHFEFLSASWIRQDQDVGGLDGVMAMDAKLS